MSGICERTAQPFIEGGDAARAQGMRGAKDDDAIWMEHR